MKKDEMLQEMLDLIDEQVMKAFPSQKLGELMFYYYDTLGLSKKSIDKAVNDVIMNYRKALIKEALTNPGDLAQRQRQ